MSAGTLAPYSFPQAFDDDGNPLDGGLLWTYQAGTTTPTTTWHDADLLVPNPNPITLTGGGRYKIYLGAASYKFVLTDATGVVIDTTDPVGSVGLVTSGVLTEFTFFGDPTSPITSTSYPAGATFTACHAGTAILAIDSATLAAGTYAIKGMAANLTSDLTTVALVNLTDGSPDTPIASMSARVRRESVTSGAITPAAGGSAQNYGIKAKVGSGAGFAWGSTCQSGLTSGCAGLSSLGGAGVGATGRVHHHCRPTPRPPRCRLHGGRQAPAANSGLRSPR